MIFSSVGLTKILRVLNIFVDFKSSLQVLMSLRQIFPKFFKQCSNNYCQTFEFDFIGHLSDEF